MLDNSFCDYNIVNPYIFIQFGSAIEAYLEIGDEIVAVSYGVSIVQPFIVGTESIKVANIGPAGSVIIRQNYIFNCLGIILHNPEVYINGIGIAGI